MDDYFAKEHARTDSQLGGRLCRVEDSEAVKALRGKNDYEGLLALAKELCFQLRYREAINVYTRAIALAPDEVTVYRQRAARYLATLQIDLAVEDFLYCRSKGGDEQDLGYRMGLCRYLQGCDREAMKEFERCYPLCKEEMGIAVMYWHTLSAWRAGEPAILAKQYRPGMQVGHHTSYEKIMAFANGSISSVAVVELICRESSDLEYPILAYGFSRYLAQAGKTEEAQRLLSSILPRDGFWICYAYLAAWREFHTTAD